MKETSLSRRLIFIFSGLFVLMLAIAALFAYQSAKIRIDRDYDAQLISESHLLWMIASEEIEEPRGLEQIDLDFAAPSMSSEHHAVLSRYTQWRAFRIWKDGRLAEQSDTSRILHAPPAPPGFSEHREGHDTWRAYTIRSPKNGLVIEAWEKLDNRDRLLYGIIDDLVAPAVLLMPLFVILLVFSVRYGLRDLRVMARQIRAREANDLSGLDLEKIPRELRPLKKALNSLLEKLRIMLEREHQFIDNAAHELKTPLAAIRLQSQLIQQAPTEEDRDECIRTLQDGIDRTRRVFDQILLLSRLSDTRIVPESCPLMPLLRDVLTDRAVIAADRQIEVTLDGDESATVQGNPDLLRILVGVLVDNAIKYTPPEGRVEIVVSDHGIDIADTGPGMPDDEIGKVFDRFYRIKGDSTQGSGLGLAIARKCADILGAEIGMENLPSRKGLKASVRL